MAGHSKWANIRFRKAGQDNKRGKLFTKLIREITISAKMAGVEPDANPRLRAAMDKAFSANMPKDTIQRAILRGSGDSDLTNYEEIRYEGYGPDGVAILVDCLSDNRKRTVGELRHCFSKYNGNLGTDGSVAYQFTRSGVLLFDIDKVNEEKLMEIALEEGAEDIINISPTEIEVITSVDHFSKIKDSLTKAALIPVHSELTMRANNLITINDEETTKKLLCLLENLEDLDDVQNVFSNANIEEPLN